MSKKTGKNVAFVHIAVSPEFKERLVSAAKKEFSSVNNLVRRVMLKYCDSLEG